MQEIRDDLKQIKQSQARVEIDIAMIKVDVGHHIKRSDAADSRIIRIENWLLGLGSAVVVAICAAVVRLFVA